MTQGLRKKEVFPMTGQFTRLGPNRAKAQRKRYIYLIITSVCSAVILLFLAYQTSQPEEATAKVQPMQAQQITYGSVPVVVPTEPVHRFVKLSQVKLEIAYWPRNEVPVGAATSLDEIRELYAKVDLPARQPIVKANLSSNVLIGGINDIIPPGHRAITIEVDATAGVEGWAFPGARVDLLLTYRDNEDGLQKSRVVVEDATVLSLDGSTQRQTNETEVTNRVTSTSTITIAVTPDDSLKVVTAQAMGRIRLVLRSTDDHLGTGGDKEFVETDWDTRAKPKQQPVNNNGFARYVDQNGNTVEFSLGPDQKWFQSDGRGEEEED